MKTRLNFKFLKKYEEEIYTSKLHFTLVGSELDAVVLNDYR